MEKQFILFQEALSRIVQLSQNDVELNELLHSAFSEFLKAVSGFADPSNALLLWQENGKIGTEAVSNDFFSKHCHDASGKCSCPLLESSKTLIRCEKEQLKHLCIPLRRQEKIEAAFIARFERELTPVEEQFVMLAKTLVESFIQNKLQKAELIQKAKSQDQLNQKLFAQSLEIDQKKQEIEHSRKKIIEQYQELEANKQELQQYNEELITLFENVEKQRYELSEANSELLRSRTEILAGIKYAQTVQRSLFTTQELLDKYLEHHFVFFKPRDLVSGDFYYVNQLDEYVTVAVADCTGHGVAAGLLTMLAITYLHDEVKNRNYPSLGNLLDRIRQRFKKTFQNFGSNTTNGLDIAICEWDKKNNILHYSGANNPIWILRQNKIIELQATRNPLGSYPKEVSFTTQTIQLEKKDRIYLFTDGYRDQFGSFPPEKFKSKRFRQLIRMLAFVPIEENKIALEQNFEEWRKKQSQTDDILVLGFEV